MKKFTSAIILIFFFCFIFANVTSAANDDKIKKHPGYVNFDEIQIPENAEESIEVYIKGPLLKLVSTVTEAEDPALSKMLANLLMIRVNTFSIDSDQFKSLRAKLANLEKKLEKQNWEKFVRVKDRDEHIDIFIKFDKNDKMAGMVVMGVEDNDEAIFVNIVGELDWSQISKLGHKFEIHELEDLSDEKKPR